MQFIIKETIIGFNSHISHVRNLQHWCRGVYLITKVIPESSSDGCDCVCAVCLWFGHTHIFVYTCFCVNDCFIQNIHKIGQSYARVR